MNKPVQAVVLHHFSISAEQVFDAWLDPAMLGRWMFGPSVREERIVRLSLDPKLGEKFSFVVERNGTEVDHVGEYLEIDRPHRLSFTWGTRDSLPETSKVTVEIVPHNKGCDVKLTHEMSPKWADFADKAAGSWTRMLDALDRLFQ